MAGQTCICEIFRCGICYFESEIKNVVEDHISLMHTENEVAGYSELATEKKSQTNDKIDDGGGSSAGNDEGEEKSFKFTTASTKMLISLMVAQIADSPSATIKNMCERVAAAMTCSGFNVTWRQVKDKWGGLKRTYKNIKHDKRSPGNNRRAWLFWDDMENVMRDEIITNLGAVARGRTDEGSSDQNAVGYPQVSVNLNTIAFFSNESNTQSYTEVSARPSKRRNRGVTWETYLEKMELEKQESLAERKRINELFEEYLELIKKRDRQRK